MPTTNRRSSNRNNNSIEINNNIGNIQQATIYSNCGATTTTTTSTVTKLPMVSIAKSALDNDNNIAKVEQNETTTSANPKQTTKIGAGVSFTAASSNEQRRQSQMANIKLISLVRRRPWLYDSSHCNYAKKHLIEKTWTQIGRSCNESGAICKERWRNIRAAFARSINIYKTQSGPNRLKPYYLHRELQFLINPMTKGRKCAIKLDDSSAEDGSCEEQEDQTFNGNIELLMEDDNEECKTEKLTNNKEMSKNICSTVSSNDKIAEVNNKMESNCAQQTQTDKIDDCNNISRIVGGDTNTRQPDATDVIMEDSMNFSFSDNTSERNRMFNCDNLSPKLTSIKKARFEDIPDDADLLFVKSLYYDMNKLDTSQKLRLKKRIYEALEQVSTISNTTTTHSTSAQSSTTAASSIPLQPPLTTTQKQSLSLLRNLDELKLQHLNRFIKYVLAPTLSDNPPNDPTRSSNIFNRVNEAAVTARSTIQTPMSVFPTRIPNPSRIPATSEGSNGSLTYPFTVKEESLDELASMLYSPSH